MEKVFFAQIAICTLEVAFQNDYFDLYIKLISPFTCMHLCFLVDHFFVISVLTSYQIKIVACL